MASYTCEDVSKRRFGDWKEFQEYFDKYCKDTHQVFVIRDSKTIKMVNKRRKPVSQLPIALKTFSKRYVCTHGIKKRHRGKGKRPIQHYRDLGCDALIKVRVGEDGDFVEIYESNLQHNHIISENLHRHYPHVRKIEDEVIQGEVGKILEMGCNKKLLREYLITQHDRHVQLKDLHNMLGRLKSRNSRSKSIGSFNVLKLDESVNEILEKDNGASIHLVLDESKELCCLSFMSSKMKMLLNDYPEVLLIDCTHGTNQEGYKLLCIMIQDCFGNGRVVQYSFICLETKEILNQVFSSFIDQIDKYKVKCIVVDKDFVQLDVLSELFTVSEILFCQFHVITYIQKVVSDEKYHLRKEQRKMVRDIVHSLVYAYDETQYSCIKEQLVECLEDNRDHTFLKYFDTNWETCKKMWVSYLRDNVAHLGNTTNNRLESNNGKIKDVIKRSDPIWVTLTNLAKIQLGTETDFSYKEHIACLTQTVDFREEETMEQLIRGVCTSFAADLVIGELDLARSRPFKSSKENDDKYFVSSRFRTHAVDMSDCTCSCFFFRVYSLPCHHVFHLILSRKLPDSCVSRFAAKRWLIHTILKRVQNDVDCGPKIKLGAASPKVSFTKKSTASQVLSAHDKYNEIMVLFKNWASEISALGTSEFEHAKKFLISQFQRLKGIQSSGDSVAVSSSGTESDNDGSSGLKYTLKTAIKSKGRPKLKRKQAIFERQRRVSVIKKPKEYFDRKIEKNFPFFTNVRNSCWIHPLFFCLLNCLLHFKSELEDYEKKSKSTLLRFVFDFLKMQDSTSDLKNLSKKVRLFCNKYCHENQENFEEGQFNSVDRSLQAFLTEKLPKGDWFLNNFFMTFVGTPPTAISSCFIMSSQLQGTMSFEKVAFDVLFPRRTPRTEVLQMSPILIFEVDDYFPVECLPDNDSISIAINKTVLTYDLVASVVYRPSHFKAISKVPFEDGNVFEYDDMIGLAQKLSSKSIKHVLERPTTLFFCLRSGDNKSLCISKFERCFCGKIDDEQMLQCSYCNQWFHFKCIGISTEEEAQAIELDSCVAHLSMAVSNKHF